MDKNVYEAGVIEMKRKTKNTKTLAIFAFAMVALVGTGFALAYPFFGQNLTQEEKNALIQNRQAVDQAIQNNDYPTWKFLMEGQLTQENFNKLVENHKAMVERMTQMNATRAKIDAAIGTGDYNAWYTAVTAGGMNPKITEVINKDNFATYVEFYKAVKNKDFTTAKQLADQLGIGMRGFSMMGFHRGFERGHFMAP